MDDCDSLIKESKTEFYKLIELLLKTYKISLIIASQPVPDKKSYLKIEIKKLENLESASMLLACLDRPLGRKEVIPYTENRNLAQDLVESRLLKDCENIPKKIKSLAKQLSYVSFTDLEFDRLKQTEIPEILMPSAIRYHSELIEHDYSFEDEEYYEELLYSNQKNRKPRRRRHENLRKQKSKY